MDQTSLDKKDMKIVENLKENSRASIRAIAKRTGIRPSTVHQRIKRLTENGVIERFTVRLNDEMMGEAFTVHMLISGSTERYLDENVIRDKHVKGIYGITGEYDLLLKLKFRDINAFNDFLLEFREKYGQYLSRTLTMVQTVSLKDE